MSRKKVPCQKKRQAIKRSRRKKYVGVAALGLVIVLCLGTVAGPWRNTFGGKRLRALFAAPAPPPTIPPAGNPSKEYIYAGGKLIAAEAPVTLLAPSSLIATTLSNLQTPQVSINWEATTGADHYQVERTTNIASSYSVINSNVTSTAFTDNSVSSVTAYLYRVRAVDSSGNVSPYSNVDLATAISFTDDSLQAGTTVIKSQHLTELRQAVNAVRATAGLNSANWAEDITAGVTTIKASHIQELRTKLDEARSALGLAACSYTNASVGVLIQKNHIDELRQCVR
jgi:chitodextrinase